MQAILLLIPAAVILALLSSTRQSRAEARKKLKPWARWLWIPTAAIALALLFG